ncbi:unnamed protein product [Colias eurytheme]|nr:unnamed protein product [Colias eurytheme]
MNGSVNERKCLELDCSKITKLQNYQKRDNCSPGEFVPICIECFCPQNGLINGSYCRNNCSNQSKLHILENIVNGSLYELADVNELDKEHYEENCIPNFVYYEYNKYCLCPDTGYKHSQSCISYNKIETALHIRSEHGSRDQKNHTECEPGTYIEFDCNVCYCSKSGVIDYKWCTYDDCIAKKTIQAAHKTRVLPVTNVYSDGTCIPGSISKVKCNFCICPESGILKERACTRNNCYEEEEEDKTIGMDRFTCEPLAYYEVDCNICFCPRDGIKNVAKCTKNQCEKNFLRSNDCAPGHLFTDVCNVCVCPPNGDKTDKACTEHTCGVAPWNQFKLPQNLLQNKVNNAKVRTLDHCFPGEEFTQDCKICVCPDMGLKMYASCEVNEAITCDSGQETLPTADLGNKLSVTGSDSDINSATHNRVRRFELAQCMEYKIKTAPERKHCTPGSMYFIRCKQCICPYMGNINKFCRPLPNTVHCEEAFPGFNYLPMGRRYEANSTNNTEPNGLKVNETIILEVTHKHTMYQCDKVGKIMDKCFICNCEERDNRLVVIEEHCFKSEHENCADVPRPTFLHDNKLIFL